MSDSANRESLLSDNEEDKAEDCRSPFIESGNGSQTNSSEQHEMTQMNNNRGPPEVENGTQDVQATDTFKYFFLSNPSSSDGPSTDPIQTEKVESCDQALPFIRDEVDGTKAEPSKFIRISATVPDDNIKDHLLGMWPDDNLPELVMTFLGGCDESVISEEVKESLKDCLTKILGKLNCCLFTCGSHVGITKLIGNICSTETLEWNYGYISKSIGIIPWHLVRGREFLPINQPNWHIYTPANNATLLSMDNLPFADYNFKSHVTGEQVAKDWPLDPNQHFYYLVDEGDRETSRMEIKFISKLHLTLCKDSYPCVMVLTGGGVRSLNVIKEVFSIKTEEITKPVLIIMKDSGKLADFLSNIVCYYRENSQPDIESAIKNASKMNFGFPISDIEQDDKEMIHNLMIEKKDLIFVFEPENRRNAQKDLQTLLFRAAEKAAEEIIRSRFLFAFNLGDSRLVKELSRKDPWLAFTLMTKSLLISNSVTRVKELLEKYEFDVQGFVSDHLCSLYKLPHENRPGGRAVSELNPERLIKIFRQKYMREEKDTSGKLECLEVDKILKFLSNENIIDGIHTYTSKEKDNGILEIQIDVNKEIINPIQVLMINSVLFLNINAAKLLWYFDRYHPLSNALLVYTLLNGLKENTKAISKSSQSNFEDIMNYFESLMCFLLNTYFKTSQKMTKKVLKSRIPIWRKQTLIEVAGDIGQKHFIGNPGCHAVLEKQWSTIDDEKFQNSCWQAVCKPFAPIFAVPKCKLIIHLLVYISSLIAFTVYVLSPHTVATEAIKWIVLVIMVSLLLDEVRQISDVGKSSCRNLKQWAFSIWNILDFVAIILFAVGFALSFYQTYATKYVWLVYLVVSYFKILQFLRAFEFLGVYMVMIGKMVIRMKTFFVVVIVSIVAYGIFMTAMLHPPSDPWGPFLFNILFRPYLLLVGETGIESFELSNTTTVFGTNKVSTISEISVVCAMAIFLFFGNILLMNLLIADFSHIHGEVLSQSEETWRYERFILLQEFKKKPFLPIPFSIFENCYHLLRLCFKRRTENDNVAADNDDRRRIADFEKFCFKKCFPKIPEAFEKTTYSMENIYQSNIPCVIHRNLQMKR